MRNDYQEMKAVFDRVGIAYTETEGDIPGGDDTVTLQLLGLSGKRTCPDTVRLFSCLMRSKRGKQECPATEVGCPIRTDLKL